MSVRGAANTKTAPLAAESTILTPGAGTNVGRWAKSRRQLLVMLVIIYSVILMALVVLQ